MKRVALAVACALIASACGDTTDTGITQLNLDRPIDIAFACYGGLRITNGGSADVTQPIETIAQPEASCDFRSTPRSISDPTPIPPGQEALTGSGSVPIPGVAWYAFMLQSEPGTVALASFDTKPTTSFVGGDVTVLDADPLTPGENGIAVGENPVAIATDAAGCYEMVANGESCDLSSLEVTSALAQDGTTVAKVDRIQVINSAGAPVRSKPAAMIGQPGTGTIGTECPATPTGYVYVAYPSCHAVAVVDVSTGMVQSSIRFDANGIASIGDGNLVCPDECGGDATPLTGTRPDTIDLFVDPRIHTVRMAIGASNEAAFTLVELNPDYTPASTTQIPLEDKTGTLGITQVAISPQIGMGGATGIVTDTGPQFQFVYGVATDGTVRVADILSVRQECDTQVDPRLLENQHSVTTLSCLPVGDPATPARRPGARGPGIALVAPAVPTSVSVFEAPNFDGDTREAIPTTLKGYFGVITATNGDSFLFNINDDNYGDSVVPAAPLETQIPLAIAHQLRDALPARGALSTTLTTAGLTVPVCASEGPDPDAQAGSNIDGPREVDPPVRNNTSGFIGANKLLELPSIRQVLCTGDPTEPGGLPVSELSFAAPQTVRDQEYPDLRALGSDQDWTLTWEGPLSQDSQETDADGPTIRTGMLSVDASNGMSLIDQTGPFCNAGVEPFDIVQLRGCDPSLGDAECPIGYTCFVHPDSKVAGLGACMLDDEAARLADACREFLISLRRYSVGRAQTGQLVIIPRTHVLTTSPVDGCTSDAQCQALADYVDREPSTADPVTDTTPPDPHKWTCREDDSRAQVSGNRCEEMCGSDADCDLGTTCGDGSVCVEGVIPPQSCVNAPQRYDVRASDAFTVIGTVDGYIHPIIADSGGSCVTDPNASPFEVGRIPLAPVACDPTADPRTGKLPSGAYDANPCSVTVAQSEIDPEFLTNSCTLANPSSALVARQAPGVRFHDPGMTMTLVDPTYPGDAMCVGDRGGLAGQSDLRIPLVFSGYQLEFRQTAGFTPLLLEIAPAFPVKTVRGPTNSIWVIDDGDFLSTDVSVASTKGQVFRIEPVNLAIINTLQ